MNKLCINSRNVLYYVFIFLAIKLFILYYFFIIHNSHKESQNLVEKYLLPETTKKPRRMLRIAQVSDLAESVPPKNYGSIERIVSYLTEEMVQRGHNVTLFAASDSNTTANLVSKWPSLRNHQIPDWDVAHRWNLGQAREHAHEFDILHMHVDLFLKLNISFLDLMQYNVTYPLMTMHFFMKENPLYRNFGNFPIVSISNDQRTHTIGHPNFIGTVYHGIPKDLLKFVEKPAEKPYLVFLGRIDPEKQPDWAIQIAAKTGIPLKIAAKVDWEQQNYWKNQIKPMIDQHKGLVEFLGEVNDTRKSELLGNALAFVFPVNWPEPFGMVLIESMACGTPVIARRKGAVPEIVEEGISGIIFDTLEEGVEAVKKVKKIDRRRVREAFEKRFTAEKMADGYEELYYRQLGL